jgi:hypothetical protein
MENILHKVVAKAEGKHARIGLVRTQCVRKGLGHHPRAGGVATHSPSLDPTTTTATTTRHQHLLDDGGEGHLFRRTVGFGVCGVDMSWREGERNFEKKISEYSPPPSKPVFTETEDILQK